MTEPDVAVIGAGIDNLFKHAPLLGRSLAQAALGKGVPPNLHPQARLGAERFAGDGG